MIDINTLSGEQKESIINIFIKYCNDNNVSCPECVMQDDKCYLAALEVIYEMVEVVKKLIVLDEDDE